MSADPREFLREHAAWLFEPKLGVCIVGSTALQLACEQVGVEGPQTADLDLAWALDLDTGEALLRQHQVFVDTTAANRSRGTLALKLGGRRLEITSLRGDTDRDSSLHSRILTDLAARDMTVGALAWWLAKASLLDPSGGLDHWIRGRVAPVGDPAERITEHPIRWIRYYRRAHQWGFELDPAIRKVDLPVGLIRSAPAEHLAAELRSALADCTQPGPFLVELFEIGLLAEIAPELASQFDGRPAGPVRHHPEISQALHLSLALQWSNEHTASLDPQARNRVAVAVLCHDLGKSLTPPADWPAHRGHEDSGIEPLRSLLNRLPGLTDSGGRRLAESVCRLHLVVRGLDQLRPGTRAKLYGRYFRDKNFDLRLFALAVGADSGGRLGRSSTGETVARQVEHELHWMRERCATVDAGELWRTHRDDKERFQGELHQAWARALSGSPDHV